MAKCILVIDDDPTGRDEVRKELESDCTEVVCVASVHEALQTFLSREFTLVILDADLSECDGYSLLEVMQTAKPIPILALSSKRNRIHENAESSSDNINICQAASYSLRDSLKLAKRAIRSHSECDAEKKCHYAFVCGKELIINPDKREVLLKGQSL